MSLIEYIADAGYDTIKTRTPATGVLVNIILFTFFSRKRAISRCLHLESFKCLVAVLLAVRARVDYCMYQAHLVGTLIARGLYLMDQLLHIVVPPYDDGFVVNVVTFLLGVAIKTKSNNLILPMIVFL